MARAAAGDQQREEWARQDIDQLRKMNPELAAKIIALPWIGDGIGRAEYDAVRGLTRLARAGLADDLIEQSWVVEGRNYPALQSLWYLSQDSKKLIRVMTHPNFNDGITEQEAKILATLHPVEDWKVLDALLDADLVTLEERSTTLPLAGEIELTIIRTSPRIAYAMDSLERAVHNIEGFMGLPFPIRHVIVLFDNALSPLGRNYDTYISVSIDELSKNKESAVALLAHEAGHYYWTGRPYWYSEGAAHIMAAVAKGTLQGRLISGGCGQTQSIVEFEHFTSSSPEVHDCHYSLGERLFRDLHRRMGDTIFRQAMRRLYLHTLSDEVPDECDKSGNEMICLVKEAITTHAPEEKEADVEKVTARWYDIPVPHDPSWIESIPVKAEFTGIVGRIEDAYISLAAGGVPVSLVTIGPSRNPQVYLNLDYSYAITEEEQSLPIDVELYRKSGSKIHRVLTALSLLPLPGYVTRHSHSIPIPFWRDTGRYWAQVYSGEHKIVEATFVAVPEPDLYSIRGVFTDTEGQPIERIMLWTQRGEERYFVSSRADGTFDMQVPSGTYILTVHVPKITGQSAHFFFVGWYGGNGSMTTDPSQAFEVKVDAADVEGIDMTLPKDIESLICPSGHNRSRETGLC